MAADVGTGTVITFQSSLFSGYLRNCNIEKFGECKAVDSSHMTTTNGWRTKIKSRLRDPGSLKCDVVFNPNQLAAYKTAAAAAAETVTVTLPSQTTSGTFACSGFMIGAPIAVPYDDLMTASFSVEFTGEPTMTSGT